MSRIFPTDESEDDAIGINEETGIWNANSSSLHGGISTGSNEIVTDIPTSVAPRTRLREIHTKEKFGVRHALAIMGFLGFANVYAMRVNLSVAMVAMVNSSAIPQKNTTVDVCPISFQNSTASQEGEFLWNESVQGIILGSFFWGYIITNPIGGRLGEIVGGKRVFCFGVFITSLLTLLTPLAARTSAYLLTALRISIGLGEGVTFPAMNSMMAKWIPPMERSLISSIVYSGSQFGIFVAYPLCGIICQSSSLGGWPSVFYLFGAIGLIWCFIWMVVVHDTPSSHPGISLDEKKYINDSLQRKDGPQKVLPIPFRHILTSMPFWAILVVHVSQNWGYYFLLTELPTYMKNILHFDIRDNSFISALPYLVMWLFSLLTGYFADRLRTNGVISTTATRKIFNSIGIYGPMICLVLAGYSGCDTHTTIALLTLGVGLNGAVNSGYMNSHLDIAANYAGTLMGFTNCIATIPGFLAPMIVGYLINGQETVSQWQLVFWIAGIVFFVGNTFYIIFITGEEQPWNNLYLKTDIEEENAPLLESDEDCNEEHRSSN